MMKSLFAVNLAGRDGIAMNGGCAHISFADKGIVTTDIKAAFDGTRCPCSDPLIHTQIRKRGIGLGLWTAESSVRSSFLASHES